MSSILISRYFFKSLVFSSVVIIIIHCCYYSLSLSLFRSRKDDDVMDSCDVEMPLDACLCLRCCRFVRSPSFSQRWIDSWRTHEETSFEIIQDAATLLGTGIVFSYYLFALIYCRGKNHGSFIFICCGGAAWIFGRGTPDAGER